MYKINKKLIVEKMGNELILFDPEASIIYSINKSGAFIYSKLKRNIAESTIVNSVAFKFKIEKKQAAKDVYDFRKKMLQLKIISL